MKILYTGNTTFVSDITFIPNETYEVSDEKGAILLATFDGWFKKIEVPKDTKSSETKTIDTKEPKPKIKG